jgi:hypothetical protein
MTVGSLNTDISLLTKDHDLRVKNLLRIKSNIEELPKYLDLKMHNDPRNTDTIAFKRSGNRYVSAVSQMSPKAALKLGRGMTNPVNHVDEICFIDNIATALPAMLAAGTAARDNAARAGSPYGNIFTTTPGYLSSESGKYVYEKVYSRALRWTEKMFDCKDENKLKETIKMNRPYADKENRSALVVLLEYNHRQLGYTDDWLREKIADAFAEGENAAADFLNIWGSGTQRSPIADKEILKRIRDSKRPAGNVDISPQGYITRWYSDVKEHEDGYSRRKLVGGLDTSDAAGRDGIALVIRDVSTAEVIGTGEFNETNLISFAEFLVDMIEKYPNLTLIIERQSSGIAIIDFLLKMLPLKDIDPFERLFNWIVNDMHINDSYRKIVTTPLYLRESNVYDKNKSQFGYRTSGTGRSSRDNLYSKAFNASTKYTPDLVRDGMLIDEISGLVIKNGRIDHPDDGHDDMVIAWLLGYWFLMDAGNKHIYKIPTNIVLSAVNNIIISEQGGAEIVKYREAQLELKNEINALLDQIEKCDNEFTIQLLTRRVKSMYNDLDIKYATSLNIDAVLENIKSRKEVA